MPAPPRTRAAAAAWSPPTAACGGTRRGPPSTPPAGARPSRWPAAPAPSRPPSIPTGCRPRPGPCWRASAPPGRSLALVAVGRAARLGLAVPPLDDLDDLARLLLARDVEARLLAVHAAGLLEADDGDLRVAPGLGLPVQLLVEEHHRRPRALGQDRAVDLLADQLALVLVVVGQLLERLGHQVPPSPAPFGGAAGAVPSPSVRRARIAPRSRSSRRGEGIPIPGGSSYERRTTFARTRAVLSPPRASSSVSSS